MTEQPNFHYFECNECGFSSVQKADFPDKYDECPLCALDSGHFVRMSRRVCDSSDRPEGFDAREA
jgi:rubrerythrin